MSLLSYLTFAYFTADLTSLLTFAPDDLSAETFQEVVDLGYGIAVQESTSTADLFTSSIPGDPFYEVYKNNMENDPSSFITRELKK